MQIYIPGSKNGRIELHEAIAIFPVGVIQALAERAPPKWGQFWKVGRSCRVAGWERCISTKEFTRHDRHFVLSSNFVTRNMPNQY